MSEDVKTPLFDYVVIGVLAVASIYTLSLLFQPSEPDIEPSQNNAISQTETGGDSKSAVKSEQRKAAELPREEKEAAMNFFLGLVMLHEALTNKEILNADEREAFLNAKIKEAQRLFKAADRDVLNKMHPGWGDYARDQIPINERILEALINNQFLVPTEKDMQLEKWWQDNLKAIVLLLRKDPDFKVLISPFQ